MRRLIFYTSLVLLFCTGALSTYAFEMELGNVSKNVAMGKRQLYLFAYEIVKADEEPGFFLSEANMKKLRIINLGPVVNTKGLDYAPTVSADGRTLYFVSDRPGSMLNKNGDPSHDFWATKKLENLDSTFFPPFNIDTVHQFGPELSVNSRRNEGVASISADNQTLVFTACLRPDGLGDCDLYISDVEGEVWGKPRNLGREVNSVKWDSQPSITSDKNRIYFASNRPGPHGDDNFDIWYTDRDEATEKWKPAEPLTAINTSGKDWSPFIGADNTTLFFASDGHKPNIGGLDFYYVKKTGTDAQGKDTWSKPVNLGAPINTKENESFLSLPASGDVMYWSSEREDIAGFQGKYDVFMAFVPTFFKAAQVNVQVVDECTGANIPALVTVTNELTKRRVADSVTYGKKEYQSIFGNNDFGNPKDSINDVNLEIVASSSRYGEKKTVLNIKKPGITTEKNDADKPDVYNVTIKLGQRPQLVPQVEQSVYAKENPNDAEMQAFRGLVMRQVASIQLHPLLNYVFFDMGKSTIPSRYVLFNSPSQTQGFSDERIPGGTLQKYYHVLNIFGYRLTKNPDAKIRIVGCTDNNTIQTSPTEKTPGLSKERATIVYNYLRDIWKISESRMKLEFRDIPELPSNPKDSMGIVENRRTEIICEDWEVIKPIIDRDPKVFPQPEEMTWGLRNGIEDELVASRRVEILRDEKPWATIKDIGTTQPSVKYDWQNESGAYPDTTSKTGVSTTNKNVYNLASYKARLVVTSKQGSDCESPWVTVPVKYVKTQCGAVDKTAGSTGKDSTLEKYNLILFPFNSAQAGPRNERILNDYVYNRCFSTSKVDVEGHTDVVGMFDANKRLSEARAKTANDGIKSRTKGVGSLSTRGVGEDDPLYDNAIPEGRFYNRTVKIVIQTPLEDAHLCDEQK